MLSLADDFTTRWTISQSVIMLLSAIKQIFCRFVAPVGKRACISSSYLLSMTSFVVVRNIFADQIVRLFIVLIHNEVSHDAVNITHITSLISSHLISTEMN